MISRQQFLDAIKTVESDAALDTLVLLSGVIIRVRPGEALRDAVAREIEDNPKRAAVIKELGQ